MNPLNQERKIALRRQVNRIRSFTRLACHDTSIHSWMPIWIHNTLDATQQRITETLTQLTKKLTRECAVCRPQILEGHPFSLWVDQTYSLLDNESFGSPRFSLSRPSEARSTLSVALNASILCFDNAIDTRLKLIGIMKQQHRKTHQIL